MRAVVQRVTRASVTVDEEITGQIDRGLLVLIGVAEGDTEADSTWLAARIAGLRIFADDQGMMNLDVSQAGGSVLAVSQFTLLGDCRKGRRPGFSAAARPEPADQLYQHCVEQLRTHGLAVETGRFQQHMQVELVNDGPVTLLLDSRRTF